MMSQQIYEPFAPTVMKVCKTQRYQSQTKSGFYRKSAAQQLTIRKLY